MELKTLTDQLFFGGSEEGTNGGIMAALGVTEDQIVYENDIGARPSSNQMFVTFAFPWLAGRVANGPVHNPYVDVLENPEDEDGALLKYANSRPLTIRLYFYGQQSSHLPHQVFELAELAGQYLNASANLDLAVAGISASVIDPGTVRDASTVLNDQQEIRLARDIRLIVDEDFTVAVGTYETFDLSFYAPDDEEEKEITP